jgi:hypothetical protein
LTETLIIAIAGVLIQVGILLATLRFLGQRIEETRKDLNGLGRKTRAILAEQIIQAKDDPDFHAIVRKLVVGI